MAQVARSEGAKAEHVRQLGGTRVLWSALLKGDIDLYPEYTGTITQEIFADRKISDEETLKRVLAEKNILMSRPLGFNDTYAIGMKKDVAEELGITKISDLSRHPELRFGFTNEFMDRGDGWPSLQRTYNLPQKNVRGLDHDLAYRGLESGSIDVTDLYSTDAEIRYYNLRVLEDDLKHFPAYNAVLLYRSELKERAPEALKAISQLEGRISEEAMILMNAHAKINRVPESIVASEFLKENLSIDTEPFNDSFLTRLIRNTLQLLFLVAVSL
ncbi:MAG: glycine betaine ABC transporter substrate-binding protein, partial [Thermodesulfobacteriota bacterium]